MASLECSMEILSDQVSEILRKLSFVELVPIFSSSCIILPVVASLMSSALNSDMAVDSVIVLSLSPPLPLMVENAILELSLNSSKVLITKVGSLESKMMALKVSVGLFISSFFISITDLIWKIAMYNIRGMNNPIKQSDIVCWHKKMNNLISIIINRFDGVHVFTSEVDSGYLGFGVAIIMDTSLAHYVCKVSEVPGQILCVRLLFKNKLSVSILRLYADASSIVWFFQAGNINFFITKAVNESSFVILGGDFNENGSHKCASFKKCFDLDLVNSLARSAFAKIPT
ncbi:hypothetical protein G9A89_010581 [Geosiphon pyriformis]|nr:hypothetical protein G9A89_010581 [Geosiphon pyriformis]